MICQTEAPTFAGFIFSRRAEAARAARGVVEFVTLLHGHHGNGHHHKLCDALARGNGVAFCDLVDDADFNFTPIVAVDNAYGIRKPDAVLDGKPATCKNERCIIRARQLDGKPRRDQRRLAALQGQRFVDARKDQALRCRPSRVRGFLRRRVPCRF